LNNRRLVERLTARLNDLALPAEIAEPGVDSDPDLAPPLAHAHHGSLSLEVRRETENALKSGLLKAVVATASLELGIDMGAVELVAQVESPGSVARGLQRVGRAGHSLNATSKGVLIAKSSADLLEAAALARAMHIGEVEPTHVPNNCLDVLAQQVIAIVAAARRISVDAVFELVRRADPYRNLTAEAFESVLKLVSGRFHAAELRDLRPRISWDPIHQILGALPGSSRLALAGGGTIPDTGQFALYLGADGPRLGELDEEFVLECRVRDTFRFGTNVWQIDAIEPDRVVVAAAPGKTAMIPFWRGEAAPRSFELGRAVGELVREITAKRHDEALIPWLQAEHHLDERSAHLLRGFISREIAAAGAAPDDRTVLVETFRDQTGEANLAILSPWGGRLHHTLKLVIQAHFRDRLGIELAAHHGDDGILLRLPLTEEPLDPFAGLTSDRAEELLRKILPDSSLFGLRFRQAAGRALLMPRPDPAKRAPLWLQRLRAKDLLQAVRNFPDFPIAIEVMRECLADDLDLPGLRWLLQGLERGQIQLVTHHGESPSPFASELVFQFSLKYLYEWDEPKRSSDPSRSPFSQALLDPLIDQATPDQTLDPDSVARVDHRLRGLSEPARSVEEMAELLRRVGDIEPDERIASMRGFLEDLLAQGRACLLPPSGPASSERFILVEDRPLWAKAFGPTEDEAAQAEWIGRFVRSRVLVRLDEIVKRYGLDPGRATELMESLTQGEGVIRVHESTEGDDTWADRENWSHARRLTLAKERQESVSVAPEIYASWLARHHGLSPEARTPPHVPAEDELARILDRLRGFAAPAALWESAILPARGIERPERALEALLATGGWTWRARGEPLGRTLDLAFFPRTFDVLWSNPVADGDDDPSDQAVLTALEASGALYTDELARRLGQDPSAIRLALERLVARGLVTNDRLDPVRHSARVRRHALVHASTRPQPQVSSPPGSLRPSRRRVTLRPEGRFSALRPQGATVAPESSLLEWARALLDRYGVLSRETASLDPWCPRWGELVPVLSRAEWRGELRRGYFVEGLSGVQFAEQETAESLAHESARFDPDEQPIILSTLDPACLYGIGAPFDIRLLEGASARLTRSAGNWLVERAGRPILIVEAHGRRLTCLPSASSAELPDAIRLLPRLLSEDRRFLKIESWNGAPALGSPAEPWLSAAGFVRDYPGMTYYPNLGRS
jgi:ATP-dependent Lhr-like helicase